MSKLTRQECEGAATFIADLEAHVKPLGDGYGFLDITVNTAVIKHYVDVVQRMADELDAWKRRAYELESIASDRL